MKCARCGKALSKAAATIPTQNGALAFGPKCAAVAFAQRKRQKPVRLETVAQDGQLDLPLDESSGLL